jgi:hypothetical protein
LALIQLVEHGPPETGWILLDSALFLAHSIAARRFSHGRARAKKEATHQGA